MDLTNLNRRDFLKAIGYSGVSLSCFSILGCSNQNAPTDLRFYGTGTLDIEPANWIYAKEKLGHHILFEDNKNDVGPIITQMISGNAAYDYDIGGLQGGAERELAEAGVILPWDMSKIPNWESVWPWVKDIKYTQLNGKRYGLPVVVNADSMIYRTDKFDTPVDTYAHVFDPKLKGKTSMEDSWINSVIFTAIYIKENRIRGMKIQDPGDLELDELEGVMEFLIEKKKEGQFKKFWSGWRDGVELMRSGEVHVMTGWEPIVYELKGEGLPVEYAIPKEGYEGWSNDLILHAGTIERGTYDIAHNFANWELSGLYGCVLGNKRGYAVPNSSSINFAQSPLNKSFCNVEEQKQLLERVQNKFRSMKGEIYWQNVRPRNYKKYEEYWAKLRSA